MSFVQNTFEFSIFLILKIREACLTIQRYMRGYLSWKYSEKLRYLERERMNVCFFDFHASLIQKV